jgi:glycine/D-amino acid oxidase-like deaminating enzyme
MSRIVRDRPRSLRAVVTEARDLRTGRSLWQSRRAPRVAHRRLTRDVETDVLVIGAGITGSMVADALSASGLDVVIIDKRGLAKGSTAASSALVLYEIDTPLVQLAGKIGKRNAARAWRRSRLAVDALAARLDELHVPGVMRRDALYLAGNVLDQAGLAREHDVRRAAGLASEFLDRAALRRRFGIARQAALLAYDNVALDPRRTTLALLQAAARRTKIFAPVEIADLDARRSAVTATAANGRRIHCRHLVFATGYELPDHVPRRGHKIISTWVIATVAQPRRLWPEQCMLWEASEPYLYIRTTPEGRVICGGDDEEFSDEAKRDALLRRKTRTLQRKLGRLFPRLDTTVEFAWTGSFSHSTTGLPKIGPVPGLPHCWAALGYGGNGITYARIAADIISGALTGRRDVDADLYDFSPRA